MVSLIATGIIIIVSLLFIGLILYSIFKPNSTHITPPDNTTINCPAALDKLQKCDPNDKNSCSNCMGGEFSCFTVDAEHPYKYSSDPNVDCTTIPPPVQCTNLPDGNWCLPIKVTSDQCNAFTSTPILTQITPDLWKWRCYCKYPEIVTKANIDGDCNSVIACDPILSNKNKLVCPDLGEPNPPCKPGDQWDGTWDPTLGVCSCDTSLGLKPIKRYDATTGQYILECIKDTCNPGGSYNPATNTCECDAKTGNTGSWTSWVQCPEEVTSKYKTECQPSYCSDSATCSHQCWPDPCNPYGYFDNSTGNCICDAPGTEPKEDSTSIVGSICASPCDNNGPCANRGTCYLGSSGQAQCKDCRGDLGWSQDSAGLCNQPCYTAGSSCTGGGAPCCPGTNCTQHCSPWWAGKQDCWWTCD